MTCAPVQPCWAKAGQQPNSRTEVIQEIKMYFVEYSESYRTRTQGLG